MKKLACILFVIGVVSGAILVAQEAEEPRADDFRQRGFPHPPHHPPPPPLMIAMDANRDGMLDPDEIANASAAMMNLDKDGDGYLTQEELRPPFPPHRPPPDDFGPEDGPRENCPEK